MGGIDTDFVYMEEGMTSAYGHGFNDGTSVSVHQQGLPE